MREENTAVKASCCAAVTQTGDRLRCSCRSSTMSSKSLTSHGYSSHLPSFEDDLLVLVHKELTCIYQEEQREWRVVGPYLTRIILVQMER